MARKPRKPSPEAVKRAADRAEATARGEEAWAPASPLNPPETEARGRGRPTKYRVEFVEQARKLALLGATNDQLADFFDVSISSIELWLTQHEDFSRAVKGGKEELDNQVERSLYQRAKGFTYDAVKVFMPSGSTEPVYAPYREYMPPDPTSMIFWLKNRRRDQWRDSKNIENRDLTAEDGLKTEVEAARKVAFMLGRAVGRAEKKTETEPHVDTEPDSAA